MNKKQNRLRRARRGRAKIRELGVNRLSIHRTSQHIYAQVFDATGSKVIASACTLDSDIKKDVATSTGNINAATIVGKAVALRAKKAGVTKVAFDRSGFKYHGRVKALADAARENGLEF